MGDLIDRDDLEAVFKFHGPGVLALVRGVRVSARGEAAVRLAEADREVHEAEEERSRLSAAIRTKDLRAALRDPTASVFSPGADLVLNAARVSKAHAERLRASAAYRSLSPASPAEAEPSREACGECDSGVVAVAVMRTEYDENGDPVGVQDMEPAPCPSCAPPAAGKEVGREAK